MTEFSPVSDEMAVPSEQCSSGIVIVTPLSEENRNRAHAITGEITRRLGTELWTPHLDITHGRILERNTGLTRPDFDTIVSLSGLALRRSAKSRGDVTATLDSIQASKEAVIARATDDVEPIASLRRWILESLVSVPGATPGVKRLDFVHATLGRRVSSGEELPVQDIMRVAQEVGAIATQLPMTQAVDRLVIAEETDRYVLSPLRVINLG